MFEEFLKLGHASSLITKMTMLRMSQVMVAEILKNLKITLTLKLNNFLLEMPVIFQCQLSLLEMQKIYLRSIRQSQFAYRNSIRVQYISLKKFGKAKIIPHRFQRIKALNLNGKWDLMWISKSQIQKFYHFWLYKMPKPQLKIEGRGNGIKTNIMNLHEIAKALNCHDQYPLKYLGFEYGSQTSYKFKNDNDVTCIINGAFQDDQIRKQLDKFIEKYILCQKCRYPEMYMKIKGGKIIYGQCDSCGHVSDLDNTHRLASYILKNPPGANQSIKNGQDDVQMINSEGQSGNKEDKQKKKKIVAAEVGLDSELLQTFLDQLRDTYNRLVVNDKLDNDVADMMLTQDIKKFNLDRHLKDRVCYLIFQSMFDENPTKAFERNYELLTTYFNDLDPQLSSCHMILNIQYLMKKRNIDDKYFGTVLKGFYDYSYIDEQYLMKWFENSDEWKNEAQSDFLYNEQLDNHYRLLSEPMINWMKSQAGQEEEYYEEEAEGEQAGEQK